MEDRHRVYIEKAKARLDLLAAEIDRLKAGMDAFEAGARTAYAAELESLKKKRDGIRQELDRLARAGGEAWEEIRAGADNALGELKSALERAAEKFRGGG